MKTKIFLIIAVFVLLAVDKVQAVDVDFYSDGVIKDGDQYNNVRIFDTPPDHTTVDMTGGLVDSIGLFDESTLNISGGDVSTINAYESSTVNASGGDIFSLETRNTSYAKVLQNAIIDALGALNSSTIDVWSGTIDRAGASESGIMNLYGGLFNDCLGATGSGVINIYGYNLQKFDSGGNYGYGYVNGEWGDYTSFNIDLSGSGTYSRISLHEIPEPSTLIFFISGSLFFRMKKRINTRR